MVRYSLRTLKLGTPLRKFICATPISLKVLTRMSLPASRGHILAQWRLAVTGITGIAIDWTITKWRRRSLGPWGYSDRTVD